MTDEASTLIAEVYSPSSYIAEAAGLSERDLAILILYPADTEGLAHLAADYEAIKLRVQKMLDLSVADREGKRCSKLGCHTEARYLLDDDGEVLKSCQRHLDDLIDGPCVVTLIEEPAA